jgi:16S rRNA (adenine1518-N6/adenine1519-N6)-dimethyltransferase
MGARDPDVNHNSPAAIRALLGSHNLRPQKRWGQNFMVNPRARAKLVTTLDARPEDTVWEIGPGLGALTAALLKRCARLVVFEIDHGLIRLLEREYAADSRLTIVPGDYLRTWRTAAARVAPDRIIGNLPFSSSSAIIAALIEHDAVPAACVFTVQKELAQRAAAAPGTRNYSSFSVLCQCLSEVTDHGELAPRTFYPVPEVTASVIELRRAERAAQVRSRPILFQLIRTCFHARRKTLRNNLLAQGQFGLPKSKLLEAVEEVGVDAGLRAEELAPRTIIALANTLVTHGAVTGAPAAGAQE